MRAAHIVVLSLVLPLAGCFADAPEAVEGASVAQAGNVTIDADRPDPVFNDLPNADLGVLALPDLNATLDAAPKLAEGEWWRIHLVSPLTGADVEFVRVVAKTEDEVYVVGMPHEGWYKEAMIYHSPAFGDVNKDLSHRAHNFPFIPVKFPLTDGASWETGFESAAVLVATAKLEGDKVARITFKAPGAAADAPPTIELVYDATVHEVVSFSNSYMTWEVIEHGYGFEGWITVPRAEELVFFHARLAGAVGFTADGIAPAAPIDNILVNGGYNRVSFILQTGDILGLPGGSPGAYKMTVTAPDGTAFEQQHVGPGYTLGFYESRDPDGDWTIDHIAAGAGGTFIEGIAYHQYDVHLPTRNIRSDHSHEVVR